MPEAQTQKKLSLFDVTNLVIGAIIGADIYVASSFGAGYLGPFSLVVWVIAGLIAIVIALSFAQCAMLLPKVGGPYAYAKGAWGPFAGFIVGWSLWLAEYSPKKELTEAKEAIMSSQNIFRRAYRQEHVFLAHVLHHLRKLYRRLTGKSTETEVP